jgi:hypothetical protein
MADCNITIDCLESGQSDNFDYDTDQSIEQFVKDLEDQGFGWAKGSPRAGFIIDPQGANQAIRWEGLDTSQPLSALSVVDGTTIIVSGDVEVA